METRRTQDISSLTPTEKIYHFSCPLRLDGGSEPQHLTGDIRELFECCRKIAEFPTITTQLFMDGILMRQVRMMARMNQMGTGTYLS